MRLWIICSDQVPGELCKNVCYHFYGFCIICKPAKRFSEDDAKLLHILNNKKRIVGFKPTILFNVW